jgi:aquaporin Z
LTKGFLFGITDALIAVSHVGQERGAHTNPIVSLGLRLMGKLEMKLMLVYIFAQLLGGILGALPLLAWGSMGRSVAFGAIARRRVHHNERLLG